MNVNYHIARLNSPIHLYKVCGVTVFSKIPSDYNKYLAELVWKSTYEESIELFNHNSLILYLMKDGVWTQKKEDKLSDLKKNIEELKVQLFRSRFNDKTVGLIKRKIEELNKELAGLLGEKHHYDHFTAENVADLAKQRFLIGCSLYVNKKRHWRNPLEDYKQPDELVEQVLNLQEHLTENELRAIARSGIKVKPLREEALEIIQWAGMYNSIRKHPECPEDFVFEDDDMMDGWVVLQRRENEKNKLQKKADELAQKHKGANEIFVQVGTKDAILPRDKVYELNDDQSKEIIKRRNQVIREKGSVGQLELPDVRQEIEMQMNRGNRG